VTGDIDISAQLTKYLKHRLKRRCPRARQSGKARI
jgi:hypothetical protein